MESILTSALYTWKREQSLPFDWWLMIVIPFVIPYIQKWYTSLYEWIQTFAHKKRQVKIPTFVHTASTEVRGWNTNSIVASFCLLMWEWYKRDEMIGIRSVIEIPVGSWYSGTQHTATFVNDSTCEFWHKDRPDIHYTMVLENVTEGAAATIVNTRVKLYIGFYNPTIKQCNVASHIEWIRSEAQRLQEVSSRKQRIYVSRECASKSIEYDIYPLYTTTSFGNFFSEHASKVREALDFFINNKDFYKRSGRPYNFTVLNHGEPGCGKTKLVKAIAEYTGRNIIVLNLQHLTDPQALAKCFFSTQIGSDIVKHEDRIYYIPELDTDANSFLRKRVTNTRGGQRTSHKKKNGQNKAKDIIPEESKDTDDEGTSITAPEYHYPTHYNEYKAERDSENLGILLNILDGIPERYGQIIIMDTNHIEKLDPAIMRPGRVDIVMKWERATGESIRKMLVANYTSGTEDITEQEWETLPSAVFTPAQVMTMTLVHKTARECFDALRKEMMSRASSTT